MNKDDQKKQITRSNVKAVFVDKRQVVIIDQEEREWLRETSDINPSKIKDIFVMHGFPGWNKILINKSIAYGN